MNTRAPESHRQLWPKPGNPLPDASAGGLLPERLAHVEFLQVGDETRSGVVGRALGRELGEQIGNERNR